MLNRVTLIGNLGRDPEIKDIGSGSKVARLSVATTESYKDKNGEWQDQTEWHTVILWNKQAETAEKWYKKGATVLVEGKLTHRSYEKDGQTRYITEVRGLYCRKIKEPQGAPMPGAEYGGSTPSNPTPASTPTTTQPAAPVVADAEDDDLPF